MFIMFSSYLRSTVKATILFSTSYSKDFYSLFRSMILLNWLVLFTSRATLTFQECKVLSGITGDLVCNKLSFNPYSLHLPLVFTLLFFQTGPYQLFMLFLSQSCHCILSFGRISFLTINLVALLHCELLHYLRLYWG